MIKTIWTATPCVLCGQTIQPGTRVRQVYNGVRHQHTCPTSASRPVASETRGAPANRPSLGYDRSALGPGEGFYGDSEGERYGSEVYGGDEG